MHVCMTPCAQHRMHGRMRPMHELVAGNLIWCSAGVCVHRRPVFRGSGYEFCRSPKSHRTGEQNNALLKLATSTQID